jgi:hypothetical protein
MALSEEEAAGLGTVLMVRKGREGMEAVNAHQGPDLLHAHLVGEASLGYP